jgi:arginyl-tRNA synthetase
MNSYYHSTPILKESDEKIKNNRLYLLERVNGILKQGLNLLSIEPLDEM